MKTKFFLAGLGACVLVAACGSQEGEPVDDGSSNADEAAAASPIRAIIHKPDTVSNGYLFWHSSDEIKNDVENNTYLTDAFGQLIHTWPTELTGGGAPGYLLEDGRVVRTGSRDVAYARKGPVVSSDTLQVVDLDGSVVWEVSAKAFGDLYFHHDIEPLPNGNFLATTYHPLSADEARAIGWDPGDAEKVWADGVIEIKPDYESGGADIVWAWRVDNHLVQDRFPDAPNYGVIAENPQRIDPHYPETYAPSNVVRQHINSVDYNAELDQIALSVFIYNEIWIIDHSTTSREAATSAGGRTGRGGDLLFRYGNPEAYDLGGPEDRLFLRQHDANWIEQGLPGAGDLLVHNNNTALRPRAGELTSGDAAVGNEIAIEGVTKIHQLQLPLTDDGVYAREPGEPFRAKENWYWESPEYFASFQGGARRLANGSTLLTDTEGWLAVEVDSNGDIAAEYHGAAPSFKAFKYSPEQVSAILNP